MIDWFAQQTLTETAWRRAGARSSGIAGERTEVRHTRRCVDTVGTAATVVSIAMVRSAAVVRSSRGAPGLAGLSWDRWA